MNCGTLDYKTSIFNHVVMSIFFDVLVQLKIHYNAQVILYQLHMYNFCHFQEHLDEYEVEKVRLPLELVLILIH